MNKRLLREICARLVDAVELERKALPAGDRGTQMTIIEKGEGNTEKFIT